MYKELYMWLICKNSKQYMYIPALSEKEDALEECVFDMDQKYIASYLSHMATIVGPSRVRYNLLPYNTFLGSEEVKTTNI